MKSRIGEIVYILHNAKSRGAQLKGNSKFEQELNSIINEPPVTITVTNGEENNLVNFFSDTYLVMNDY